MQKIKIESYRFGCMVIDGRTFTKDLIIYSGHVEANWWRAEGHCLQFDDLKAHLEPAQVKILVVGTGQFGMMKVPDALRDRLAKMNIQLVAEKTTQAVVQFNQFGDANGLMAAFHLTC